jgi:hypothetical protein
MGWPTWRLLPQVSWSEADIACARGNINRFSRKSLHVAQARKHHTQRQLYDENNFIICFYQHMNFLDGRMPA